MEKWNQELQKFTKMTNSNRVNYTVALERIDEIVALLSEEEIPLEKIMEYVREATDLIKLCEENLLAYEEEVQELLGDVEE